MQSISLSVDTISNKNVKSVSSQTPVYKKNEVPSIVFSNEFEWDDILDESFSRDFDANGNLIQS